MNCLDLLSIHICKNKVAKTNSIYTGYAGTNYISILIRQYHVGTRRGNERCTINCVKSFYVGKQGSFRYP